MQCGPNEANFLALGLSQKLQKNKRFHHLDSSISCFIFSNTRINKSREGFMMVQLIKKDETKTRATPRGR